MLLSPSGCSDGLGSSPCTPAARPPPAPSSRTSPSLRWVRARLRELARYLRAKGAGRGGAAAGGSSGPRHALPPRLATHSPPWSSPGVSREDCLDRPGTAVATPPLGLADYDGAGPGRDSVVTGVELDQRMHRCNGLRARPCPRPATVAAPARGRGSGCQ
ncbi:uncharacterized protein LOC144580579 [Callithrix jacchus]